MVEEITVTEGLPTTWMPLSIVVMFSMIKDALEDY